MGTIRTVWCLACLAGVVLAGSEGMTAPGLTENTPGLCHPDVGAIEILIPRDTVCLDSAYTPTAIIRDFGGAWSIFPVTMKIGNAYTQTITCTLDLYQTDTVTFSPDWIAGPLGTHPTMCFTELSTDLDRSNDTAYGSVTVIQCCTLPDVGALEVIWPRDTLYLGTTGTPKVLVKNFGSRTATFPVTLNIGTGYSDTVGSVTLGPGDATTVSFNSWTAAPVGHHITVGYTWLSNDRNRSNDTAYGWVEVVREEYHDVGCDTILLPQGLVDSGTVHTPTAIIRNYGSSAETFPVVMRIGIHYSDTIWDSLAVGESKTVSFRPWTAQPIAGHTIVCHTNLDIDENRSNDTAYNAVCVRPPAYKDVSCDTILIPWGTLDSGLPVTPTAVVQNHGNRAETFPVTFTIGTSYSRAIIHTLAPGQIDTVIFPIWHASPLGTHPTTCWTGLADDINRLNDTAYGRVTVVPPPKDVGVYVILAPADTVDSGKVVTPRAIVQRLAESEDDAALTEETDVTFPVIMNIGGSYTDTVQVTMPSIGVTTVTFNRPWTAQPVGTVLCTCYTALSDDPNRSNDTAYGQVIIPQPVHHDVGASEILAPVGTVDSGSVHTPQAWVHNYGNQSETFPVVFTIGTGYSETDTVSLGAGDSTVVSFPDWTARMPGMQNTMCYTELESDEDRSNDTAHGEVEVLEPMHHDVGAYRILEPTGNKTLDSVYTPQAMVRNYGDYIDTFPVVFTISNGYVDTVEDVVLAPGDSALVSFADWTADSVGFFYDTCYTMLESDEYRRNDTTRNYVRVSPIPYHDVGVLEILVPRDTVDSGTVHTPMAVIHNFGNYYEYFPVVMEIGTGYLDSVRAYLPAGRTDTVEFRTDWFAEIAGNHPVVCYTQLLTDEDRSNDTAYANVFVRPPAKDVGVVSILAPRDTVDSGTVITPMAVVHRFADFAAGFDTDVAFPVVMNIGGSYSDTVQVTMPTRGSVTVAFNETWVAEPLGTVGCTCYTVLDDDADRSNDTAYGAVVVVEPAHHDVGATAILVPSGTVDSGAVHTPLAVIHNHGNRFESFEVVFTVDGGYSASTQAALGVGQTDTIAFQPDWIATEVGSFATVCYTTLADDEDRSNDTAYGEVVVEPPEPPPLDVGVTVIWEPTGTKVSGDTVTPRARVSRFADGEAGVSGITPGTAAVLPGAQVDLTFWVTMMIGTTYVESTQVTLGTAGYTDVGFSPVWIADPVGMVDVVCYTSLAEDINRANDTAYAEVEVVEPVRHDVGVVEIVAPVGTVDSGTVHTPVARVVNFGNRTETFPVVFTIDDGYMGTQTVTLSGGDTALVSFPFWQALVPGTYPTVSYTVLETDEDRSNDTVRNEVTVDTTDADHDVGAVRILWPQGILDSGSVHTPKAVVRNYGNRAETFPVTFKIGVTAYTGRVDNVTLDPGDTTVLEFPSWIARPVGYYLLECFTQLPEDMDRSNDTTYSHLGGGTGIHDTVFVVRRDVAVVEILVPKDTVDSGTVHTPQAVIHNYGGRTEVFDVTFKVGESYTSVRTRTTLLPDETDTIGFDIPWDAEVVGTHPTVCYTQLAVDMTPGNDTATGQVVVRPMAQKHDVGTVAILAPVGTSVVSAAPWTVDVRPRAVIENFSSLAEADVMVRFKIEDVVVADDGDTISREVVFTDDKVVPMLEGNQRLELEFEELTLGYGSYAVSCSTMLATDADPSNDRKVGTYTVSPTTGELGPRLIRIYTRAGEFVRELAVPEAPAEPWVFWDGKNDGDQTVAKGTYLCLVLDKGSGDLITSYNALVPEEAQTVRLSTGIGR